MATLEPQVRVVRQVRGYLAVGAVEALPEVVELAADIVGTAEGAAHRGSRGRPRRAFEEPMPRVGKADAGRDEDLATLQRCPEALEDGEDVGMGIDPAAGVEDVAAPYAAHGSHKGIAHGGVGPARERTQVVDRLPGRLGRG
jgi:hypothetical protein